MPPPAKLKPEARGVQWIQSRGSAAGLRAVKKVDSGSRRAEVEALAQLLDSVFLAMTDSFLFGLLRNTDIFCLFKKALEIWVYFHSLICYQIFIFYYITVSIQNYFFLPCLQEGNLALEHFFPLKQ